MSNIAITSKKDFFEAAKTGVVTRTLIGSLALEEWPEFVANTKAKLIELGCPEDNIEITETKLVVKSSGQFWTRPRTPRVMTGKIVPRSKDFYFESDQFDNGLNQSYCDKANTQLIDGGLELETLNGAKIRYTIN